MQIGRLKIDGMYILFIVVLVTLCFGSIFLAHRISNEIEKAGGVKQIIIEVGKDVKDIVKEIEED